MTASRSLPSRQNPHTLPANAPSHEELVSKRRLGRTDLHVSHGQVGTSNATKPANLGVFDYAHLRVSLPKDLHDSGIFVPSGSITVPSSYFLMRRSSDGYLSATGMFKAAYPWASKEEEEYEREHVKSLATTDQQEVAGNCWVSPECALTLAAEYNILPWVHALLDPAAITLTSGNATGIAAPPSFIMVRNSADATRSTGKRTASRELRSASPVKMDPPTPASRPKLSPKKRGRKAKSADKQSEKANGASKALQSAIDETASIADVDSVDEADLSAEADKIADAVVDEIAEPLEEAAATAMNGDAEDSLPSNTARVTVTSDTHGEGDDEVTHTTVKIDMPADAPDQGLPADPQQAIADAKKIVEDAMALQQGQVNDEENTKPAKRGRKRKASETEEKIDGPEEIVHESEPATALEPASKRTRVMVPADEYRREKMQKRAVMGLSATLAVGAMIPFISSFF